LGLDTVELIVEMEKQFNIAIPDREAEKIATVGQLSTYILRHQNRPLKTKEEIDKAVIAIVSACAGIDEEEIELHHSFTNDLGMD